MSLDRLSTRLAMTDRKQMLVDTDDLRDLFRSRAELIEIKKILDLSPLPVAIMVTEDIKKRIEAILKES